MKQVLTFTLNGSEVDVLAKATDTLLDVLREKLGLIGPKRGCDSGDCGTCTVLINGEPIRSCLTIALTVAGKEVVQVYLSAPAEKLDKPREELVAFAKTDLLVPGQSEMLSFDLSPRDLPSFDTASSSWVAEAGQYEIKIGASSRDIRQTASFSLGEEIVVRKVNKALAPQREIKRILIED